jgi:hypothetical protein
MLMMKWLVQIRPKFWWHNRDVLRCTILGVQLENDGVMLLKFCLDLNLTYHHKYTLSVTLGWVCDLSFPIYVEPRYEE